MAAIHSSECDFESVGVISMKLHMYNATLTSFNVKYSSWCCNLVIERERGGEHCKRRERVRREIVCEGSESAATHNPKHTTSLCFLRNKASKTVIH